MATNTNPRNPASRWVAITPDDDNDLDPIPRSLYVTGAGNLVLRGSDGNDETFPATDGQILPLSPTRVLEASTATGIIGLL